MTQMPTTLAIARIESGIAQAPTARVVIPAFRAEQTIRQCVTAITTGANGTDYEIVVVDDGGNKDLAATLSGLSVTIVGTGGTGSAAAARNRGAAGFTGRHLVFVDADVLVEPCCLEQLLAPLRRGQADATVGNYSRDVKELTFAARYKQLYVSRVYDRRRGYLNNFWTAIGAIDARLFYSFGGFDTGFRGANGEDAEFGHRLATQGYRILAVPEALGQHRHLLTLRGLMRNDWRKGVGAMAHYFRSTGAMSDNCHATQRDKAAVALIVLSAFHSLMALAGAAPVPAMLAAACAAIYLALRSDILIRFASQGVGFVIPALGVMALLDLLRCACVGAGLYLRARHWAQGRRYAALGEGSNVLGR